MKSNLLFNEHKANGVIIVIMLAIIFSTSLKTNNNEAR